MVNLIIAYALIAVLLSVYVASIVLRTRRINRALRAEIPVWE